MLTANRPDSAPVASNEVAARTVHYVLSSHWDREWYQTFQDFRRRLVRLMDRALDDIESEVIKGAFTTDGQTILIEDYLEVRPERRAQVERFIQQGRLKLGPWYVLPDEWLVSGEAIIRNLLLGRQQARDLGGVPSDAGFVCDLFGHISQLPQIFKNFGIEVAFIWRGIEPRAKAHLKWRGADGSELLCYRFGRSGYCDYALDVRRTGCHTEAFDGQQALADLSLFLEKETARTDTQPLLVFDGADHLEYDTDHYAVLLSQKPSAEFPWRIVHSTLDAYIADLLASGGEIEETVEGELREAARLPAEADHQWLIPGVLSSRVWIKQANAACQSLLTQWAEPFSALASLVAEAPPPHGYLDVAWKWLLQNHPHDSICGCSIDAVHEDMKYRFAQCEQIATAQVDESLERIAAAIPGELSDKEVRVLVANPLPRPVEQVVEVTLQIPEHWGCFQEFFGFEPKPAFRVFDAQEKELPWQLLSQQMQRKKLRAHPQKFPQSFKTNDVRVALRLKVPALGYTMLTVREGAYAEPKARSPIPRSILPVRHASVPGLASSERSMENAFLAVVIESNGTLTLTDKRNGQTYSRLLTFEDRADIGDGWYYGPAVNDRCFVSTAAQAEVALLHDGPELCEFLISTSLRLPESFDFDQGARSARTAALNIETYVALRADADRLELRIRVDNTVKDHRLRVLFPTAATTASHYFADSAFDAVKRPIALPADNAVARELTMETTPQQSWTAVCGQSAAGAAWRGLAVVSEGLMESAVQDLPERPLALTLLRATRRTVLTDGEPEGQIQGAHEFRCWLAPQLGEVPDFRALCEAGQQLAAGFRVAQFQREDIAMYRLRAEAVAPLESSLLELEGEAVLSSIRQIDGALEVRVFNPSAKAQPIALRLPSCNCLSAVRVNFEGVPLGSVEKSEGCLNAVLAPKEIATWRLDCGD